MRILLVNSHHYPGGGDCTYVFNLARLLQQAGHIPAFFAMQDARNRPDPNQDLFVSPIDFRALNQAKSLANSWKVLTRSIYSTEARKNFRRLIDRFQPDLVHLHNIEAHLTPSVALEAHRQKLPLVWTLHDYRMICPNSHLLIDRSGEICQACQGKHYYQAALKRCKKDSFLASLMASLQSYAHEGMGLIDKTQVFLTPSNFLRQKLLQAGFPAGKVVHLPLFVETPAPNAASARPEHLLFMARLEVTKGIRVLIEASRLVPQVKVVLAGSLDPLLADALLASLPANVTYVGLQDSAGLAGLLQKAYASLTPSIWYENQPFSILEAFAAGKPVIASDLGGMTELVAHGQRGLLVPPGDPAALAQAMGWMVAHPEQAQAMGASAQAYVQCEHNPRSHAQAILDIYRRCLPPDSRPAAPQVRSGPARSG